MSQPSTPSPERAAQGEGTKVPSERTEQTGANTEQTHAADATVSFQDDGSQAPSAGDRAEGGHPSSQNTEESVDQAASDQAASDDFVDEAARVVDEAASIVEEVAEEVAAKAQAEAREWQDKFMRLHAEWDTYRRRTAEQRELEKARAAEKLVESLLPVIDDFERTIDYAQNNGETGLLDGVKAVHAKLVNVLEKDGVQVIDPVGEVFDALEAQAVATVEDTSAFDETVNEVYQKGYKLGEKVLRPAMVTVTTGGPKREKPQEAAE